MRLKKIGYAPRAESGPIFNFYRSKNTSERKNYIMDSLVVQGRIDREIHEPREHFSLSPFEAERE